MKVDSVKALAKFFGYSTKPKDVIELRDIYRDEAWNYTIYQGGPAEDEIIEMGLELELSEYIVWENFLNNEKKEIISDIKNGKYIFFSPDIFENYKKK